MANKLLTTGQAAKLCSVTPDTVLKWIRSGRLSATRTPGGHHRVSRKDIIETLNTKEPVVETYSPGGPRQQFRYCWEFNGKGKLLKGCEECIVYVMRAKRCYEVVERAREIGHNRVFCEQSCKECDYYQIVHRQPSNVLVVTDNETLASELRQSVEGVGFNLEVTSCEYTTSALVDVFRPDYAVVDCSIGNQLTRDICCHLVDDPRIPYVRIVLAAAAGAFPEECDREVFARIETPFSIEDVGDCIRGEWEDSERTNL